MMLAHRFFRGLSFLTTLLMVLLVIGGCSEESSSNKMTAAALKISDDSQENVGGTAYYTELEYFPNHTYRSEIKSLLGNKKVLSTNVGVAIDSLTFFDGGERMLTYTSKTSDIMVWNIAPLKAGITFSIDRSSIGLISAMTIEQDRLTINGLKASFVWDLNSGKKIGNVAKLPQKYSTSLDKRIQASIEKGKARIWDVDTGNVLFAVPIEGKDSRKISLSADGSLVAIAIEGTDDENAKNKSYKRGGRVQVWNVNSHQLIAEISYPRSSFTFLKFTADNKKFIAGSYTGRIVIWDLENNQNLTSIQVGDGLRSMEISPGGTLLATGGSLRSEKYTAMGIAVLWDVNTGEQLHSQWFPDRVASAPFGGNYWAASSWGGAIKIVDYTPLLKRR